MDMTPVAFRIANIISKLTDCSGHTTSNEIRVGVAFAENINLCFMDYVARREDLPEYRLARIRQLWGMLTDDQRSRFSNVILHPDHTGSGDLVMSWIGPPEDGSAAGQHVA